MAVNDVEGQLFQVLIKVFVVLVGLFWLSGAAQKGKGMEEEDK